jgi:predicted dehydrogenase
MEETIVPEPSRGGGSPLRAAVAGTGFIGAVHVRSARLAGAHVVGVSASSAVRAEQAAAELRVERAFASSEELVQADDVDVVHVCTPNHLHQPLAEAALAAGKHVICEKPLALDVAGARRLVDAAAAAGRVAAVPFVYRYYPTVREARERVRRGATGPLRLLHGTYLQDWLLRAEDNNWRVDAELGGASRTFADIGSHWCDLAEFVSGHRIAKLSARLLTALPQRLHAENRPAFSSAPADGEVRDVGTEDAAVVQFETDQGAIGTTIVSQISAGRKNRLWLEVDGAEEALAFSQEDAETLWVGRREAATLIRRDPEHLSPSAARLATLPAGHPQGYADCFDLFVDDVYAEIRGEAPRDGVPMFSDGLRAAQIIEAVLASAQEERWIDVAAPVGAAS